MAKPATVEARGRPATGSLRWSAKRGCWIARLSMPNGSRREVPLLDNSGRPVALAHEEKKARRASADISKFMRKTGIAPGMRVRRNDPSAPVEVLPISEIRPRRAYGRDDDERDYILWLEGRVAELERASAQRDAL
jgi:hypothetical protein